MTDPTAFDHIRQWGDPVLRETARPVETFDAAFAQQVGEMIELMRRADGAGLAATQVGALRRVFVYRLPDDEDDAPARVVVNPELVETSDTTETALEGCLSLGKASVNVEVERPQAVVLDGFDEHGRPIRIAAEGGHARVLQHELDHLDGVLMLDRTTPEQRRAAVRALNAGVAWRPESEASTDP
ncbi:MAG TPA: peptide deformylase [Solirubrobacter sp.]|nr:peptide deformylase [Solirubrobacter sp.]